MLRCHLLPNRADAELGNPAHGAVMRDLNVLKGHVGEFDVRVLLWATSELYLRGRTKLPRHGIVEALSDETGA